MKRGAVVVAIVALAAPVWSAAAEPLSSWGISTELRVGSVTAPFYTEALSEVSSEFTQARLMVFDGFYRISGRLWLGGRLPAAPSTVRQPAGSYSDEKAFGNPELYLEDRTLWFRIGSAVVLASARVGVGAPVAEHGSRSSLLQNRVVALSNALDDWRNPELYEPGVVPITLRMRGAIEPRPWGISVSAKLPVLVRISEASLPDEAETRALGLVPVVEAFGSFRPARWFEAQLGAHLVAQALPAASPPDGSARNGRLAFGVEPRLAFYIRKSVSLTAGFNAAIGGPLSGSYGIALGVGYRR